DVDILALEIGPERVRHVEVEEDVRGVAVQTRRDLAGVAQGRTGDAAVRAGDDVARSVGTEVHAGHVLEQLAVIREAERARLALRSARIDAACSAGRGVDAGRAERGIGA